MLQTRSAKRPAQAAVRFAVDAVGEGLLSQAQAIATIEARSLRRAAAPHLRPRRPRGPRRAASPPRRARPRARSSSPRRDAVAAAEDGRAVILVRPFTEADDVAGFHAAEGILTSEGGKTACGPRRPRHGLPGGDRGRRAGHRPARPRGPHRRARPARGRPDRDRRDGRHHHARRRRRSSPPRSIPASTRCSRWADELRTLGVRANADTPEDARRARIRRRGRRPLPHRAHVYGRRPPAEDAADDHGRRRGRPARRSGPAPRPAAGRLRGIFEAMEGLPITIRLLDPPLHEFAPDRFALVEQVTEARLRGAPQTAALEHLLERVAAASRRGQPDARHSRRAARDHPSRDLRDAGARDLPRRRAAVRERTGHRPPRGDHDPARRLRPASSC